MTPSRLALAALLGVAASSGCHETEPVAPGSTQGDESAETQEVGGTSPPSTSLRNPNDGSLASGVPLPLTAPGLRFNPKRDDAARYATVEVVQALVNAARMVDAELGGLPVTVNDLSYESGGPIPHHGSHQSGRDVDVLFYQVDRDGKPVESVGAFFDPKGVGIDFRELADPLDDIELHLDVPRTWRFVQALIENEAASLQSIYLAEHLRSLLLDYAHQHDAPESTVARFADMTCQPGYPHDDHFHFRFYCSVDDIEAGCRDSAPLHAWRKQSLAEVGVQSLPLLPKREHARTKTVSHEEARQAAGPLDAEVERWLDRRKGWRDPPHPGRRYCK